MLQPYRNFLDQEAQHEPMRNRVIDCFRALLYEPRIRDVPVNDPMLLELHAGALKEKRLLRSAFETFYRDMVGFCDRLLCSPGIELELGTGVGFFRHIRPNLITSDIRPAPSIDVMLDAQELALRDKSVRCIYAINVFHHLPNPDRFFEELCRVLHPGGGCILIEPNGGSVWTFLHRHMQTDEYFDPEALGWQNTNIRGPMSGANQALADIVFTRDFHTFHKRYGDYLEIAHRGYCLNGLRYLLSGGLNFRQILPSASEPILRRLESLGSPLARYWSVHQVVVLRKRC
jgi:SAM-dependent methyltransferase